MTHLIALEVGQSSQGALKPITPVQLITNIVIYFQKDTLSFIIWHVSVILLVYFHHYWEIGKSRPVYPPPPPQKAMHSRARVVICECLVCYVNRGDSIFKSLNNDFYVLY